MGRCDGLIREGVLRARRGIAPRAAASMLATMGDRERSTMFGLWKQEPLADLKDYLDEAKGQPLPERKALWWSLVAEQGIGIADELGDRLDVEERVVSRWIREWIQSRQAAGATPGAMAVETASLADLTPYEKARLQVG